jgi:hypothetical protein
VSGVDPFGDSMATALTDRILEILQSCHYGLSGKWGLSENSRTEGAVREVQRSSRKSGPKGPNGPLVGTGEQVCLGALAEGEELKSNISRGPLARPKAGQCLGQTSGALSPG